MEATGRSALKDKERSMIQEIVNFTVFVTTTLSKEAFIHSFPGIDKIEKLSEGSWKMTNKYAYFMINDCKDFFVNGLIRPADLGKLIADLEKIDCDFSIDLYDDDHNLIDTAFKHSE